MITVERVISLMQEALDSLHKSGIVETKVTVDTGTPLFGAGSNLDSMGFVTFVTDIEERLNQATQKDLFIVLSDLEEMYPGAPVLTAKMFADYLVQIARA